MTRCLAAALCTLLLALLAACQVVADAGDEPAPPEQPAVHARRCPHCGWIEAKRELLPRVAGAPRAYEYTVRMADGSSSVFQEALPASWRLGERLTVIGGDRPK
jgi:hypothetical protein